MAIFTDSQTKLVVQGITGRDGSFHTKQMMEYGTAVVAGVTPGKGGQTFEGPGGKKVPIFNSMDRAVAETGANASVIFVPPAFASGAVMEAADSGVTFVIAITEGVPVQDMARAHAFARDRGVRVLGPNCPGLISVGGAKIGILPGSIVKRGHIGVVSRSGTLTYEAVYQLSNATTAVVMIGEIGGTDEQEAAAFVKEHMSKPVVGFIAGQTAPPGRRMGHAGAIISGAGGTAAEKMAVLEKNGVPVAKRPADIVGLVKAALA